MDRESGIIGIMAVTNVVNSIIKKLTTLALTKLGALAQICTVFDTAGFLFEMDFSKYIDGNIQPCVGVQSLSVYVKDSMKICPALGLLLHIGFLALKLV